MTLTDKIHKRLRPYAKERGLLRKGRTYYTITEDTAYCFSIENHTFDIYVHFYLIPLYMREENHILTYGNLLNSLFFEKIPTLQKTAAEEEIDAWVAIVTGIVDSYVLPFFRQVGSPEKLLDFLALSWEEQKDYLFCPPEHRLRLKAYTLLYRHRQGRHGKPWQPSGRNWTGSVTSQTGCGKSCVPKRTIWKPCAAGLTTNWILSLRNP